MSKCRMLVLMRFAGFAKNVVGMLDSQEIRLQARGNQIIHSSSLMYMYVMYCLYAYSCTTYNNNVNV